MDKALIHLRSVDIRLAALIAVHPRPTFVKHDNYYHELVSSIISQQLSVKAAYTIEGRFKELFGGKLPAPEEILEKNIEELRAVGLSRPKAHYIQDLAMKIIDGSLIFDAMDQLSNDAIIAELTKVKGVGVWTAHMFLMLCMGRLDVLPTGDLGIRNGVARLYEFRGAPTEHDVERVAKSNNWHPYESVASWYIWQSLGNTPQ